MKTRHEYIETLAGKIKECDKRLDDLRGRVDTAQPEFRERLRAEINEMRSVTEKAKRLLVDAHEAGEDTWNNVRSGIDELLARAKELLRKAA